MGKLAGFVLMMLCKRMCSGGEDGLIDFPETGIAAAMCGWWCWVVSERKTTKRVISGTVVFVSCRLLFCFCIRVFIICALSCLFACTELVLTAIKQLLKAHLLIDIFATILTSPGERWRWKLFIRRAQLEPPPPTTNVALSTPESSGPAQRRRWWWKGWWR